MSHNRRVTKPQKVENLYNPKLKIKKFSDIQDTHQQWLWNEHIPLGCYTLIAGV